ncbi:Rrf2 family transcriptional regulator [Mycoplasma sp. OR1901]|uniref:Rrf2 family transcriptional regulator n=1 Tax=Mycoplasma sp. OR1901 TaxID=2742195 RepID=UPI0015831F82|nr:Rrf2 family transcriptional regulator [Mycoplasma sp. OR1901]QKT05188.1 Rrf2 family transcriptional regulator [Mycoplasma sp. OR1901]
MQISSRFTVALHIFACIDTYQDDYKITSDFLAGSINTNPVIIRKILSQLKNAKLITVARGTGGIEVTRPFNQITFYDVYQAIEPLKNGDLFNFHENPNPQCIVGGNIHTVLDNKLKSIQEAMEKQMKSFTIDKMGVEIKNILLKQQNKNK